MVEMSDNEPEWQPPVKAEKETLLKKFDIPVGHLDYKYLSTCNNGREIEQILQILRSGEEGHFPDLIKFTENRLFQVNPRSKYLRTCVPILTKYDIPKDEWQNISSDLQGWIEDINKNDKELLSFQDIKPTINVPLRRSNSYKNNISKKKADRIKSMDYDSWDKLDVDAEILKMDLHEEKIKKEILKKNEEKEKLNTIVLNPDIMTKAELTHSALQAKNSGNECFRSGDFEDALQYYTNSLTFLTSATVYNNRAITNIKLHNYSNAINDCNEALKLEPRNEKSYLRKSLAYKYLKQYEKAIEILEKLIQINPNNIEAQNMIHDIKKKLANNNKLRTVRMTIQEDASTKNANNIETTSKESTVQYNMKEENDKKNFEIQATQIETRKNNSLSVEKDSAENILVPIPSTSKCAGPFYKVVNVSQNVAQKITNTKKTHSKSDENVIDLNYEKLKINKTTNLKTLDETNKEIENSDDVYSKGEPHFALNNNNFTPYEFLKKWQSIKHDPDLEEHEKLLRALNPTDLVTVLGNKLDGEMFSILLNCLATRFTKKKDIDFISCVLREIQKLPRIDIIMLLLNKKEKNVIRNLLSKIKKYGDKVPENVYEKYYRIIDN